MDNTTNMSALDLSQAAQNLLKEIYITAKSFIGETDTNKELDEIMKIIHTANDGVPNIVAITEINLPLMLDQIGDKKIEPQEYMGHITKGTTDILTRKAMCIIKFNELSRQWLVLLTGGGIY